MKCSPVRAPGRGLRHRSATVASTPPMTTASAPSRSTSFCVSTRSVRVGANGQVRKTRLRHRRASTASRSCARWARAASRRSMKPTTRSSVAGWPSRWPIRTPSSRRGCGSGFSGRRSWHRVCRTPTSRRSTTSARAMGWCSSPRSSAAAVRSRSGSIGIRGRSSPGWRR